MRKAWRSIHALLAALLLAVPVTGCGGGGGTGGGEPLRIGVVLSLTGTYAALGTAEQRALELEVDRVNAAGGVNGRGVELVIEDDATDETKAAAAAVKLIGQDGVVALIGASGTGQTMAMRGAVERAKVPQVSMAGGSVVTSNLSAEVFQTPWPNKIVVPFVLKRMSARGHKKVGLISDSGGYGVDGHEMILEQVASYGMTVASDQVFDLGDRDMTVQLAKIGDAGADCILMWTAGREAATVVRNREALHLDLPVYCGSGIARREFVEDAGTAAEGVEFGTGKGFLAEAYPAGSPNRRTVEDFAARFEAAYGEPPDIFAGHAYDAIHLVVEAARRVGDGLTSARLRGEIERTRGFVGYGGTFTFSPTDHSGLTADDLQMYRISGGEWELATE